MTHSDGSDFYVCCRIAELPEPYVPSIRERCARCNEPVWVDRKHPAFAASMTIVCQECMVAAVTGRS